MQRVISRVHQIVTSGADATGARSASASLESLAAAVSPVAPSSTSVISPSTSSTPSPSTSVVTATQHKEIALAVERLQYATLLGERKKAVGSLQDLAKSYATHPPDAMGDEGKRRGASTPHHVALGLAAIPAVLNALLTDPRDTELMEAMLELLQEFVTTSPATATAMLQQPPSPASSSVTSSLRSAATASVSVSGTQLCLQLLQDPSPWIRGPTITLVKAMQEAQQREFAASVLECKEGLRRLLEVVEDKREHIRDAALQVLVKMTEREKNVQQFLAFEDGFIRLFQIMEGEGLKEGSSVVSDCLQIINNMLRDNLMNQTLFLELPYLATHLPQLLSLPSTATAEDEDSQDGSIAPSALKSTQKKRTMKLVLQLVRFLVSEPHEGVPDSKLDELALRENARKHQDISQIQSLITRQAELMGAIGEIVCCGNEELTDLQLQALDMIQLLCSGNGGNQIILVNLQTLPTRRSLLSELIKLDIAEDETPVSAAATSLLDVLLASNESAKMAIFQHLNAPPPIDDEADHGRVDTQISPGRVLLEMLINNAEAVVENKGNLTEKSVQSSTILAWKACHRFASLIAGSAYCKELALRIPSQFDKPDAQAVSGALFITRCLKILSKFSAPPSRSRNVFQVKIAVLTMLIQWCIGCTSAVRELVGSVTPLSILVDTLTLQQGDDERTKGQSGDEIVQLCGLTAVLLGTCLEYLIPTVSGASSNVATSKKEYPNNVTPQLTRHNLVDLISKKVGLESFSSMLVQFQQSPQFIGCARTTSKHQRARALLPYRSLFVSEAAEGADDEGYLFPLYDRSFTVICREMVDTIQNRVLSVFTSTDDHAVHGMGGNDMNAPSAASAYQDLIRMQDKQIRELQRQVFDLSAQLQASDSVSMTGHSHFTGRDSDNQSVRAQLEVEIQQLRSEYTQEKEELERKLSEATNQSTALESRVQGLSRALEHLEAEHSACEKRRYASGAQVESGLPNPTDAITKVMADLERENDERRRLEEELRLQAQNRQTQEKKNTQDAHAWQMAQLQLQQELDSLRTKVAEQEEQLREQYEMIDVFRQGQESAKRSAAQMKIELERANRELDSMRGPESAINFSSTSKHEVAAQEMYQLWEKERVKVRELKAELDSIKLDLSTSNSRCQEFEKKLAGAHGKQIAEDKRGKDDDGARELERLGNENEELRSQLKTVEEDNDRKTSQLTTSVTHQLEEINQLRNLLTEMQHAAEEASQEAERQNKVIEELKEELTRAEERAQKQRRKSKETMAELEEEIARMFFDKTEIQRKSKASLKEAEHEIARMFLEKVELEKQVAALPRTLPGHEEADRERTSLSSDDTQGIFAGSNAYGSSQDIDPPSQGGIVIDEATAMDDMLIIIASLEIQCNTLRECLEAARGEEAVVEAVQLSRQRGALML